MRTLALFLALGSLSLALAAPRVAAISLEVNGAFEFADGSDRGTWFASAELDNTTFTGQLTMISSDPAVPRGALSVAGSVLNDRIVFGTMGVGDGPSVTFESEPLRGAILRGTFVFGTRTGIWTSTFRLPAGQIADALPEADAQTQEPRPLISSRCDILNHPVAYRNLSSMSYQKLVRDCSGGELGGSSQEGSIVNYIREALWGLRGLLTHYSSPPPALGQQPNRLVNDPAQDSWWQITQSEPSIAISPANRDIILVAYNDSGDANASYIGWSRSNDRGLSWTDKGPVLSPPSQAFGDPVLAADASGQFFLASIYFSSPSSFIQEIAVYPSLDNGQSFSSPTIASVLSGHCQGELDCADKPDMAIDPVSGNIYVCWAEAGIRFARSVDGGANFTELPSAISDLSFPEAEAEQNGCAIAIGDDGNVYVAWYENQLLQIHFKRSSDYGASFPGSDTLVAYLVGFPPLVPNCCGQYELNAGVRYNNFPSIAVDPLDRSRVFVTWNQYLSGSAEIAFSRSTNMGATWSAPVRVNSTAIGDQFQPRISTTVWTAAEPDTTAIRIAWYDRRNDPSNRLIDVYSGISFDGGISWQESRWTDAAFDVPAICGATNFDCTFDHCYMGDYIALASFYPENSLFIGAWGDNRGPAVSGPACHPGGWIGSVDPNVRVSSVGC